jgi:hypothetical protein
MSPLTAIDQKYKIAQQLPIKYQYRFYRDFTNPDVFKGE